jgi:hypothetical protein
MLQPGIHDDIPADAYHADPCELPSLSASIAHLLCTASPAHARAAHPKLNPTLEREEDDKFAIGTASHALLLQGEDIAVVIDAPNYKTKVAQEARDAARATGFVPLLVGQWGRVQAMVAAARDRLDEINVQPRLLTEGKAEQTIVWDEDGVACRARLDWLRDDHTAIDDVKTTIRSANPDGWTRSTLFSIGADIQAVMYRHAVLATTGVEPEFRFIIIESQPPYELSVVSLGPDVLVMAEKKLRWAVALWRKCLASGEWPGYPRQVCFAEMPAWEENRWLEKELREEAAA